MPFSFGMKRFVSLFCVSIFLCASLFPHDPVGDNDNVLMKIDGEDIYLSEFDYFYNKVASRMDCSRDEYFHYFLRYKMKVYDAKRLGLDKNADYERKIKRLEAAIRSYDNAGYVDAGKKRNGAIKLLTYRVCQNNDMSGAIAFMNGVCSKLKSGATLQDICDSYPELTLQVYESSELKYCLGEVRSELQKIQAGGCSSPFVSPEGVNIVLNESNTSFGCSISDFAVDALLASEWDRCRPDDCMKCSDDELEHYFKANKKKYMWELPHYKGAVIHCKNKKSASKIKKKLRKLPVEEWTERLRYLSEEDFRYDAIVESGLFCIGENEYVDKLVFKCGNYNPKEEYPYTFVIGKCLDYMPGSYEDVYDVLLKDYMLEKENRYFDELERKLRVEKYIDVLKTVNSSGSN